ncbi:hypothetical protein [Streptomyces sp. NPDC052127]
MKSPLATVQSFVANLLLRSLFVGRLVGNLRGPTPHHPEPTADRFRA